MQERDKYVLTVSGCDDYTKLELDLTGVEFADLETLCMMVNDKQTSGCQPTMEIEEA